MKKERAPYCVRLDWQAMQWYVGTLDSLGGERITPNCDTLKEAQTLRDDWNAEWLAMAEAQAKPPQFAERPLR